MSADQPCWFETHTHLSDPKFGSDQGTAIQRAIENNVTTLIEIADGPEEWEKAKKLSHDFPDHVWWAAGLHPYFADLGSKENFQRLKELTNDPRFVAIGEVGLDYFKCAIPPETQKKTLTQAIELALEVNKPLIIHCREAYPDLVPLLKPFQSSFPSCPGVIHCFSGNTDDAKTLVQMGFYLGVDGPITYPNAKQLRETLLQVDLDHLVIETDSPYLPPQGYRGQRNEPGYLPLIGQALAELKNRSPLEVSQKLHKNSTALFRLN